MLMEHRKIYGQLLKMAFPPEFIPEVQKITGWSEGGSHLAFEEYLRFMMLKTLSQKYAKKFSILPSSSVSQVWQAHTQFAQHHQEFCAQLSTWSELTQKQKGMMGELDFPLPAYETLPQADIPKKPAGKVDEKKAQKVMTQIEQAKQQNQQVKYYQKTMEWYVEVFLEQPPPHVWGKNTCQTLKRDF